MGTGCYLDSEAKEATSGLQSVQHLPELESAARNKTAGNYVCQIIIFPLIYIEVI